MIKFNYKNRLKGGKKMGKGITITEEEAKILGDKIVEFIKEIKGGKLS